MPIEIKELHVKVTVKEEGDKGGTSQEENSSSELIQDCVDQVMDILKDKKER